MMILLLLQLIESIALKEKMKISLRNAVPLHMTMMITLFAMTLALWGAVKPALTARRVKAERLSREQYACHQLKWARRAHPELQDLSYREILRRYDLEEVYRHISVRR